MDTTKRSGNFTALSDREREVLSLAADGLTDKEIAQRLGISLKTVRTYWDRMRNKLSASSRTQVLGVALREALFSIEENESRLRNFLDALPFLFVAYDEERNLLAYNEEARRVTGIDLAELRHTRTWLECLIPNTQERGLVEEECRARFGNFRDREVEITCGDGTKRVISWTSPSHRFPVLGWPAYSFGTDVTALRKATASRRAYDAKLRWLFESFEQGLWLLDSRFATEQVNDRMAQMLATDVQDLQAEGLLPFLTEEEQCHVRQLVRNGGCTSAEFSLRRRDGQVVRVRKSIRPFANERGEAESYLMTASPVPK